MIQQTFYFLSDYFMNPFPLDCALLDETSKIFCQIIFLLKNSFWSTYKKKVKMESYAVSSEPVQKRIHNHNLTKFYYDFIASKVILQWHRLLSVIVYNQCIERFDFFSCTKVFWINIYILWLNVLKIISLTVSLKFEESLPIWLTPFTPKVLKNWTNKWYAKDYF